MLLLSLFFTFAFAQEVNSHLNTVPKEQLENSTVPAREVNFVILDKVTAKRQIFRIPVGESVQLRGLIVRVENACKVLDPARNESLAFFKVFELQVGSKPELIFANWISATYPGYSCLEHPRYTIAVLESLP